MKPPYFLTSSQIPLQAGIRSYNRNGITFGITISGVILTDIHVENQLDRGQAGSTFADTNAYFCAKQHVERYGSGHMLAS